MRLQRISIEALKIILVFTIISLTSYLPVKIEVNTGMVNTGN